MAMTLREVSARAQSLGVSIPDYLAMSQAQRQAGASVIGSRMYGAAGDGAGGWTGPEGLPPLPGGGGGGGYVTPYSQTQAGMAEAAGYDKELAQMEISAAKELERLRQKGALTIEEMRQKFALEQQLKQIGFEREALYVQYKGRDPVRAVMLGMGMLGEGEGGLPYEGLPRIKGAGEYEKRTEAALGGLVGRPVDITAEGVAGLPEAIKTARTYQFGGEAERTLLTSGYGVGREGLGGGLSSEEFARRIQEVTPTGQLRG